MKTLRLGMIGTGRITNRFIREIREVPYVKIAAVYNPHEGSAARYAKANGMADCLATDNMEEFLASVDVVYIAAPHGTHYDYARRALAGGKHVLCEKPMCLNGGQAVELYQLARRQGLVLMEAIKTAYCPGFQGILKLVESGKIGTVYDVEACFTRLGNSASREVWDIENGGSYTEFGTYSLLPIVKLLGTDNREAVFWSLPACTGVDSYTKVTITYTHAAATAKTGLGVKSEGQLVIAGSNGYILVPSPWWLTRHVEVHYEDPNKVEVYDFPFEGSGLRYEITSFIKRVLAYEEMQERYSGQSDIMTTIWSHIMQMDGVTPEESIWLACQMESFHRHRPQTAMPETPKRMNVWAHRGCCMRYPENTLVAFQAAAQLPGITGIELDVQLTRDGELVVIHDEDVERTTTGTGAVRDYLLEELKQLNITGSGQPEACITDNGDKITVPTLREVFDTLAPYCKANGMLINIELKNSIIRYEGMEQKVIDLAAEYGLVDYIIYSSFLHESMGLIKSILPSAKTGTLSSDIYDCIKGAKDYGADALHPWFGGLDINRNLQQNQEWRQMPIRAWGGEEPFYGQNCRLSEKDLRDYAVFGVTDIITNVPERYL